MRNHPDTKTAIARAPGKPRISNLSQGSRGPPETLFIMNFSFFGAELFTNICKNSSYLFRTNRTLCFPQTFQTGIALCGLDRLIEGVLHCAVRMVAKGCW